MTGEDRSRPVHYRHDAIPAGATEWARVRLIVIDDEAEALRLALEQFGLRVDLYRIGQARHLVTALSDIAGTEYVVLNCHGEHGDIVLPELAAAIEAQQPVHRRLTSDDLTRYAQFDGALVISTGCTTGTDAMGQAVLAAGATGYLAPTDYPEGHAAFFALTLLFYELTRGRDIHHAVTALRELDPDLAMWRLHTA